MGAEPRQGCAPESHRGLCFGLENVTPLRRKKVKNSLTAIKAEEWRERRARGSYGLERETDLSQWRFEHLCAVGGQTLGETQS